MSKIYTCPCGYASFSAEHYWRHQKNCSHLASAFSVTQSAYPERRQYQITHQEGAREPVLVRLY